MWGGLWIDINCVQLDDVDLRRETGDAWSSSSSSGSAKQVPKSVHHRTTCNFQKSNGTSLRVPTPAQTFASARYRENSRIRGWFFLLCC
jgi:hypothetical protein